MLRQLKNYLLHDVSPDDNEFLTSPGTFMRKLLLDEDNRRYRHGFSQSISSYSSSAYPTPGSSRIHSRSASVELSPNVVDDGHPGGLGNAKILHNILRHLSAPDLLTCRLVSLRWNIVSSSILPKKLGYTIVRPSKLKSFIKLMEGSFVNPISSYAIRVDQTMERHTKRFLHLFCLQIVNLRVRLNITELVDFARHLQNMRNLRNLHVIFFDDGSRSNNHLIWNSSYQDINVCDENGAWKMGLYSFSNVSNLQLENAEPNYQITPFYDRIVANIITACGNLRKLCLISWNSPLGRIFSKFNLAEKLGALDTIGRNATADEMVDLFFNTNLRFHNLRMEVTSEISFELLADVIHRCGDSLYELVLVNENIFEKFILSSTLRSLIKLKVNLWSGPVEFTEFARQYPALRMISLNLSNLFEVEQLEMDILAQIIPPCQTVKTLMMTRLETGVDAVLIEKLSILFPNVRELFVEVKNGSAVEKIYQVYSELTLLCIELNQNIISEDDEAVKQDEFISNQCFTGVPDAEINISQEMECGCPILDFHEESRSCWNIGCLKNLCTLLLRVPNNVNNITLLEGISRLNNLQKLVLLPFYHEEEEPVKWCLRSIADNFPKLEMLVTSSEIGYSEDDVNYLMERIPRLMHRTKL